MNNTEKKSSFYIPLAIVLAGLIIAGAIVFTKISESPPEKTNQKETARANSQENKEKNNGDSGIEVNIGENDHVKGNPEAPITVVEFSDFQCPYCEKFHPSMQQITKEYPEKVRWVYKHFPLSSIHPHALSTALASECAGEQGKFWEFADKLFENSSNLGDGLYKEIASELGLNIENFNECLSSEKYAEKIKADYQEGVRLGVRGTPTSFINGRIIPGALPYESLKIAVETLLSEESQ